MKIVGLYNPTEGLGKLTEMSRSRTQGIVFYKQVFILMSLFTEENKGYMKVWKSTSITVCYRFYFFNWLFRKGNRIVSAKKWWELIGLWKASFVYPNVNFDKKKIYLLNSYWLTLSNCLHVTIMEMEIHFRESYFVLIRFYNWIII